MYLSYIGPGQLGFPAVTPLPALAALTADPRFAGLAVEALDAGDTSEALGEYLGRLPPLLVSAIRQARATHRWAPCSECGEGILIAAGVGARGGLTPSKVADGPVCRISFTTETIGPLTTTAHCRGRHFPLEGPWLRLHPLGWETEALMPW